MKIGDKIKLTTTDPDGTLHEKTLIKTSSGTLVDKDSGETIHSQVRAAEMSALT